MIDDAEAAGSPLSCWTSGPYTAAYLCFPREVRDCFILARERLPFTPEAAADRAGGTI